MSKKHDRYKEDYSHIDIDQLDEIETEKFEKFRPKKKHTTPKKDKKSVEQDRD